jgi:hypothetical protein
MRLKVYSENRCPVCGRTESAHRISRGRIVRWLIPNSALMKCRLCLTRYLVRRQPEA